MKKTLLFIALIATTTFFAQTNLVLNGTCDIHTVPDNKDNADSWDMTPNSKIKNESGVEIDSPYRALWYNKDLADAIQADTGDGNEQPGSSSDGNWDYSAGADQGVKTGGVKISSVGRRLYQKVAVTAGKTYTFTMDSRSEAQWNNGGTMENVNSEVFILNTEIADENGLNSGSSTVDAYLDITNDFNSSKSNVDTNNFTTNTFEFTASGSFVVIYVRASDALTSKLEVFYDNISLVEKTVASVNDAFSSNIAIYPNPANDFIQISTNETITGLEIYNVIGKKVISSNNLTNKKINVSNLTKGVYILKIMSNDLVGTRRFLIE